MTNTSTLTLDPTFTLDTQNVDALRLTGSVGPAKVSGPMPVDLPVLQVVAHGVF